MSDNRLFDVNGRTKEQLALAVKLLLLNEYGEKEKVKGWYFSKNKGLVLTWFLPEKHNATAFTDAFGIPKELEEEQLVEILWEWLKTDQAKTVDFNQWESDIEHDGSNELGWRLYVEEWGHVRETEHTIDHYSIAAFKPVYLWYGK